MSTGLAIADLAKAICPPRSHQRVMALLRAYCDASFSDPRIGAGWTAVAGYVGTDAMWTAVEAQWAENKKLWEIEEFSVAALMAGEVPGIGFTRAELCVGSFGKILMGAGVEGVAAAINDADFDAVYKSERFPTKYHMCVSMLFHAIDMHVSLEFKGDSVAVILDTDGAPDGALHALCEEWKIESKVIAAIAFATRAKYPLLECADLCAGMERTAQLAGGRPESLNHGKWYSIAHAHRHKSVFWSLEDQKRVDAVLEERERRRRQREGEG